MTNEEKKAYDNLIMLKYFTPEKEDKEAIQTILNLIEKQSKEIKELKEQIELFKNANDNVCEITQTLINKNYISKDKIKSKIEEWQKERYIAGEHLVVEVLQSLLEEE